MLDVSIANIFSAGLLPGSWLQSLTPYFHWLGFIGFAGATLYFILERSNLAPEFRVIASLNAVVALITVIGYYHLAGLGGAKLPFTAAGTQLRYMDWLITLPLMLLQIPVLLGMDRSSRGLVVRMVLAAIVMVAVGMVGECLLSAPTASALSINMVFTLYGIGVLALLLLLFTLVFSLNPILAEQPVEVLRAFGQMRVLILLGYSLGFLIPLTGLFDGFGALRDLLYGVADLVNKLAFGLVAMAAAQSLSYEWVDEEDGWTEMVLSKQETL